MQTVSPAAIKLLRSHKRWVVLCAFIQALAFAPLLLAASRGAISAPAVLVVATIYWGAGLATGPAWNTWIGTIVPAAIRPRYFAKRTRASQATTFLGFLVGGLALQLAGTQDRVLVAFAALFAAAGLCRLVSAALLATQSEPTPIPLDMRHVRWRELLQHVGPRSGARLLVYLVVVQAAVQMAGPYFTPFMLKKLDMSYAQYVTLISTAFLGKVLFLPVWGGMARVIGAQRLLWIGGIGITPLSAAWLVSTDFSWLMLVQLVGGAAWAAYELAFFLLFFESIPVRERTSLLTLYNLVNTLAWVGGALLGGALLQATASAYSGYELIFAASAAGRIAALLLLARVPALDVEAGGVGVRTLAVRPSLASLDVPVLSSLPDQPEGFDPNPEASAETVS